MPEGDFNISLRQNGEHSFKRSLESYKAYESSRDLMFLKDTIMFLHQSIELLMKQMLVSHSPYLIFEELKDIPRKQTEANKQGTGIFFIEKPPRSATYEVAIDRVEAFLNPIELDENLKQNLNRLNRLRNQLEHYAIEADREEVVQILEAIHEPILRLFENHLGPLTQLQTPHLKQTWKNISATSREHKKLNHEIYLLMGNFNGQQVPGGLLGLDKEVVLPKFTNVFEDYNLNSKSDGIVVNRFTLDIFAHGKRVSPSDRRSGRWVVSTKLRTPPIESVYQIYHYGQLTESVPWLVVLDVISNSLRIKAKELKVMVTSRQELEELKKIVDSANQRV